MAFACRVGSVLRRTSQSSISSLLQAVRCMSSSKLFVGGLSYATDDPTLKDAFSHYGDVCEARVIIDRDTGRSKGFGFITYTSSEAAAAAISAMDGKDLQGRTVRVAYATDRAGGIRGGGGYTGNYGSGGYGNTGYGSSGGGYAGNGGGYASGGHGSGGGCGTAGYGGYSGGAGGGEYSNMHSNTAAGGYGSGGSYNSTSNSDGNTGSYGAAGGYNSLNTYGSGSYNSGGDGNAAFSRSTAGFSSGHFGVAGVNNGGNFTENAGNTDNFAGNVTRTGSHNGNSYFGGFGGGETIGANKVQYNGQDDLLGEDCFSELEDRHASRSGYVTMPHPLLVTVKHIVPR